jgi:Mn2+/Fe2+ NRAMP family transporter
MGEFVNPRGIKVLSWVVAGIIAGLNIYLLGQTLIAWLS